MHRKRTSIPDEFSHRPFARLDRLIADRNSTVRPKTFREPEVPHPTDDELFREAMKKVREIRQFREMPAARGPSVPAPKKRARDEMKTLRDLTEGRGVLPLPATQEYTQWRAPACPKPIPGKLHRGEFSVQDSLDLHGMTMKEAESGVEEFLKASLRKRLSCIKIIHGRGLRSPNGPVLKDALFEWLTRRHRRHVLAFTSARQCDGGLGAVYVLLRHRRA